METESPPKVGEAALKGTIWAGLAMATFFTTVRFYIRYRFQERLFLDDLLVAIALLFLLVNSILYQITIPMMYLVAAVQEGTMRAPADIASVTSSYMKLQFAIITLFWTCLWTVKFSILVFLNKLNNRLRGQRRMWTFCAAFIGLSYIGCVISYPISCASFKLGACNTEGHVNRSLASLWYSTAVDVLTDLMLIIIPLNLVWKVQKSVREKLALGAVFCVGFIIIGFAVTRAVVLNRKHRHPELSWLAFWSATEASMAIIVSCLASFRTLLTRTAKAGHRDSSSAGSPPYHKDIDLGEQGGHQVNIRGGRFQRQEGTDQLGSQEAIINRHEVHVQTDVEISRTSD